MIEFTEEQRAAVKTLRQAKLDTDNGMPQELFLMLSGLVPLANVDLLITNEQGQILLTRRCDPWYQPSWHIPGGCMHYGEDFLHCVQQTAMRELGTKVIVSEVPVAVRNVIRGVDRSKEYPRERGHNVAILFSCQMPEGWMMNNGKKTERDDGYAAWFDILPEDFMEIQRVYADILEPWLRQKTTETKE